MPTSLVRSRAPGLLPRLSRLLTVLTLLFAGLVQAQSPDLTPSGYINDFVGVLSPSMKQHLESLATEVKQKTGAEIAVAVVPSLGGETVEDYANLLGERWEVGDQDDRGALLVLAIEDRKVRWEIGYGLEPIITDGRAGAILDQMTPSLRKADYDSAIGAGVLLVAQVIAQDAEVTLTGAAALPQPQRQPRRNRGVWWPLFFILPFLLWPRRRRYGGWQGNALTTAWMLGSLGRIGGRGGIGGGSFGSGGFGGFGGGGFGGGGASRSW
jgi:uncharacterized protein